MGDICIEYNDRGIWKFVAPEGNPNSPSFWSTKEAARGAIPDVVERYHLVPLRIVRVKAWIGDMHNVNYTVIETLAEFA